MKLWESAQLVRVCRAIDGDLSVMALRSDDIDDGLLCYQGVALIPFVSVTLYGHAWHAEHLNECARCRLKPRDG